MSIMHGKANGASTPECPINTDHLHAAVDEYAEYWALTDQELMELCQRHPHHRDRAAVNVKILIIGRSYATGIERKITVNGSQGNAISQVAEHLVTHADEVDGIIHQLPHGVMHLRDDLLEPIVVGHGRLVELLGAITRNSQSTRSFVSKYLHFHRPIVPVYDSFAEQMLQRLIRWQNQFSIVSSDQPCDRYYHRYVMRFWQLCRHIHEAGEQPTVKMLDYFLLCEAHHPWTKRG